jgi:hypothetical protein
VTAHSSARIAAQDRLAQTAKALLDNVGGHGLQTTTNSLYLTKTELCCILSTHSIFVFVDVPSKHWDSSVHVDIGL